MSNWNHSSHKKIVLVVISYREMFALQLNKCVHRSLLKIQDNWLLLHLRQHLLSLLLLLRFCFWTKLTLLLPRTDQSRVLFISYPIFPQAHNTTCTWVYVHRYIHCPRMPVFLCHWQATCVVKICQKWVICCSKLRKMFSSSHRSFVSLIHTATFD